MTARGGPPGQARIAVTGATGRIGGGVARRLAAAGVPQRLLVRDAARAPSLPGAEVAVATYDGGAAVRAALQGIETVLMVSAAEDERRVAAHLAFVDAVAAAGVDRLVYLSFVGAAPDATFTLARDHWATEEHLRASGLATTVLRDNIYLDFLTVMAGEDGVIRGPAGQGRMAGVARDDVVDVAGAVLLDPAAHEGSTYDVTGPEALTLEEAAATMSRVTGRAYAFQDETLEEAYASRAGVGAPDWQVDAWVSTYTAIRAGELEGVSDTVPRLAGHPATSLEQLLRRG